MSFHWEDGITGRSSVTELGVWNQWLFWQQSYRRGCGSMGAWLSPWPCFLVSLQCLQGGDWSVGRAGRAGRAGQKVFYLKVRLWVEQESRSMKAMLEMVESRLRRDRESRRGGSTLCTCRVYFRVYLQCSALLECSVKFTLSVVYM
jgi:hypothetical protein